ncbi:hypothetical protein V2J09_018008 [Rumex salicifolius]
MLLKQFTNYIQASMCIEANILAVPIPRPSAMIAALSVSGLTTDESTFAGFLPKHTSSRKERLQLSANQKATQIFFVPPHILQDFLKKLRQSLGTLGRCVIPGEMTKIHKDFILTLNAHLDLLHSDLKYVFNPLSFKTLPLQTSFQHFSPRTLPLCHNFALPPHTHPPALPPHTDPPALPLLNPNVFSQPSSYSIGVVQC